MTTPNKPGALLSILEGCARAEVSVLAARCSRADAGNAAIQIVTDRTSVARDALKKAGHKVESLELLEVSGADKPGACCSFISELAQIDIQSFSGFANGNDFVAYVEVQPPALSTAQAAIEKIKLR